MNKHLKLFSALLVLMLFAPVSMFVCPADAEAAQTLVENSWRYEGGQLVSDDASSEEDGIALLSMDALPDGVTAQGIDVSEHQGRIDWDAVKASGIDFAILGLALRLSAVELTINLIEIFLSASDSEFPTASMSIHMLLIINRQPMRRPW